MSARRLIVVGVSLFLGATLATAVAAPASAHNYLVATAPAAGSVVAEQPGTVSLTTNDALLDLEGSTALQVVGPDGRHYETACPTVDAATAAVTAELGPAGEYTVAWQVVSTDGHPIGGEFVFDWAPGAGQALGAGSDSAPCPGAGEPTADNNPAQDAGSTDEDGGEASVPIADVLWIGGAVLAVLAAALATWLVLRRRA